MNKITLLQLDFTSNTVKILRTDNGYKNATEFSKDYASFRKYAWKCLHSPKVLAVTFISNYYRKDIMSMVRYCEMQELPVDIIIGKQKFHTSREFQTWFAEQQTAKDEWNVSIECVQLIAKHARELMPYLKKGVDVLIDTLRQQIKLSGYDVDLNSLTITDGLNHGKIDDSKGIREWSRDYTKHYERYQQNLIDLINMYINCKFYAQAGFEQDRPTEEVMIEQEQVDLYKFYKLAHEKYGVNFNTAKAYCTIYNMDRTTDEVVVVPVSACSEYTQMKLN